MDIEATNVLLTHIKDKNENIQIDNYSIPINGSLYYRPIFILLFARALKTPYPKGLAESSTLEYKDILVSITHSEFSNNSKMFRGPVKLVWVDGQQVMRPDLKKVEGGKPGQLQESISVDKTLDDVCFCGRRITILQIRER